MILSFTLVFLALAVLFLLLYLEGGRKSSVHRLEDLVGHTRPVDIDAFRNLMDPQEEDYLRANLVPCDFRVIQRERSRAAIDYIRNTEEDAKKVCLYDNNIRMLAFARGGWGSRKLSLNNHFETDADLRRYEALLEMADLVVHHHSMPDLFVAMAERLRQVTAADAA